jgi:hypothetical protein
LRLISQTFSAQANASLLTPTKDKTTPAWLGKVAVSGRPENGTASENPAG